MSKFNINAEELVQFFVERGAKHSKGDGGFKINGESIDPVQTLRDSFQSPIYPSQIQDVPVSSFYQVDISKSSMEYPVMDERQLVA